MMTKMLFLPAVAAMSLAFPMSGLADGQKDNTAANVRPVPPLGVAIPDADKDALSKGVAELKTLIEDAKKAQAKNPKLADLLPDVEIFHKSVDWALRYNQFNNVKEVRVAQEQLTEGKKRAEALKNGEAPWTKQKGLVLRAYRSKIDGSVQPYGMVIPESYTGAPTRLDFWIHGRGETLSELAFVDQRMKSAGQIQPKDALVLHPYGRYCCANKMAGEVDLFEALEHAKKFYRIDDDRIIVRGFSMGGASAWQFGTHFASQWCAVNPGAGFAETPEFLGGYQSEDVSGVPEYQKTLWHLYNSSEYALNLFNVPTIAYSGEIDKQKQAADVMERELKKEGLNLLHIIGPQTAHKLHPDSLVEIERRLADIAAVGRNRTPREVHFTTWTLRYNEMAWVRIDAMEEWKKAKVDAKLTPHPDFQTVGKVTIGSESFVAFPPQIKVKTENVRALTLTFPSGQCPLEPSKLWMGAPVETKKGVVESHPLENWLTIDDQTSKIDQVMSDRSLVVHLVKKDGKWQRGTYDPILFLSGTNVFTSGAGSITISSLKKHHGLQGPIDDAFWDSFVFVTPSGPALNPAVEKWVGSELPRAVREWQKQFRGVAPQKKDTEIQDDDIAKNNLVLWGDPSSNAILKKIADKLPIKWTADGIEAGGKKYSATEHMPVLIYPNPLNPTKYVVLNSGFTYREYDYLNNARQVPKLPDWAIVNLSEAPNAITPGKIVDAGFFDEAWKVKEARK